MHVETYSTFFTPRDEEPSLSSSEEKSSEFDWLERKIMRKQKYKWKTEQVLCKIYFFLSPITWWYVKKITKLYIRGYSPFALTRRVWGFRHQISKAKYLKMSVVNIGKLQENTAAMRTSGLRNFAAKRTTFRCPRLISQPCEICLQLGVIGFQWL